MGWDEAFVGATVADAAAAEELAQRIQAAVAAETRLTCAVGIGDNLLRAKIATEFGKPGGRFTLTAENWVEVMGHRPTRALWGIGAKTAAKLAERGITTVDELAAADPAALAAELGPALGPWYVQLGRGIGRAEVRGEPWVARSHGREETFPADLTDWADVRAAAVTLAHRVAEDVRAEGRPAARVGVKVRFAPFTTKTRSMTLPEPTSDTATLEAAALEVLERFHPGRPVRLVGVRAELRSQLHRLLDGSHGRTPCGAGGRSTITTGRPSSRAATSLAAVRSPPLSRQTTTSIRCSRSSARSASAVTRPGPRTKRCRAGSGPVGGSSARSRNQPGASAKAAKSAGPVARNARSPSRGAAAAAAAMSGTRCQWSPGPAVHPGLRSTRSGRRSSAAAATASSVIRVANGWVASTTASVSWSRSQRVSPAPPKPPIRTSPSGSNGTATAPASDDVSSIPRCPPTAAASRRASAVPARRSTRVAMARR